MRSFTEEQVMFRQAYRKFLEQEIKPNMEAWRKAGIVDRSAVWSENTMIARQVDAWLGHKRGEL